MILYHGTSTINALNILKEGFDLKKSGSNWGKTYGKGIYFSPNYKTAEFYAGTNGIIISININLDENNIYYLKNYNSPNSRKKPKINNPNIKCLVSPDKDEYLILNF